MLGYFARYRTLSPLVQHVLSGAFWSVIGSVTARILALASSLILARILGKSGFGEFGIIQNTIGLFAILAGMGLGTTATKYIAEYRGTNPEKVLGIIKLSSQLSWGTGLIMAAALVISAKPLAIHTLLAPHLGSTLRLSALLVVFGGVAGAQSGVLAGFQSFKEISSITLYTALVSFAATVLAASIYGLEGAVAGLIIGSAFNVFINKKAVKRHCIKQSKITQLKDVVKDMSVLWKFSLPVTMVSLLIIPANWACNAMLARSASGYAAVGDYAVATQWRNIVVFVPAALVAVVISTLSGLISAGEIDSYKKILKLNLLITGIIAGCSAMAIIFLANVIARTYGEDFVSTGPVISLMAISGFLIAMNSVVGNAITSLGRAWVGFVFCTITACILVFTAQFLIPIYGATGVAVANVVAYLVHSLLQGLFLLKFMRQ